MSGFTAAARMTASTGRSATPAWAIRMAKTSCSRSAIRQGNFTFTKVPPGDWRVTVFDQWNDMLVDGLSTPVGVERTAARVRRRIWVTSPKISGRQISIRAPSSMTTRMVSRSRMRVEFRWYQWRCGTGMAAWPMACHGLQRDGQLQRNLPAVQLVCRRNRHHPVQEHGNPRCLRRGWTGRRIRFVRTAWLSGLRDFRDRQQCWRTRCEKTPLPANLEIPGSVYCGRCGLHGTTRS